ncbi:MAG: YkvA family protein [Hyphomicrobiales bacterium]
MTEAASYPDYDRAALPAAVARNERTVRDGFWKKLKRNLAKLPFAEHAVAAWFCAFDPATPLRAKGILLAALAYFVMPFDVIPDAILGLGFTDDMTVLLTAISLIRNHMKPDHYDQARETLKRMREEDAAV